MKRLTVFIIHYLQFFVMRNSSDGIATLQYKVCQKAACMVLNVNFGYLYNIRKRRMTDYVKDGQLN